MKNFYIAVTIEGNKNENIVDSENEKEYEAGYYAYIVKCKPCENLKNVMEKIGDLKTANIAPTQKEARRWVEMWNDGFKKNGTYLFDTDLF